MEMGKLKLNITKKAFKFYSKISISEAVFTTIFKCYICENLHSLLWKVEIEAIYIKAFLLPQI